MIPKWLVDDKHHQGDEAILMWSPSRATKSQILTLDQLACFPLHGFIASCASTPFPLSLFVDGKITRASSAAPLILGYTLAPWSWLLGILFLSMPPSSVNFHILGTWIPHFLQSNRPIAISLKTTTHTRTAAPPQRRSPAILSNRRPSSLPSVASYSWSLVIVPWYCRRSCSWYPQVWRNLESRRRSLP